MPVGAVLGGASLIMGGVSMVQQRNAANRAADAAQAGAAQLAANELAVSDYNAQTIEAVAKANAAALTSTADYNARVARAEEAQVGSDAAANVRLMRRDASIFLSRQRAAQAGSGIRADTGSALAVRVASAGQLALREAEFHRQTVARMEGMEAQTKARLAEAQSQAGLSLYEAKSRADLTRMEGKSRAEATRISGQAQADSYHQQATASLLNGASRMLASGYSLYQGGAFSFGGGGGGGAPGTDLGYD